MPVAEQNIKVKANIFVEKLSEYVEINNKSSKKIITKSDTIRKSHRVLLNPEQIKEIKELILLESQKKKNESKEQIPEQDILIPDVAINKLKYNPESNSFSLSDSMIERLTPKKQSIEVRGLEGFSNKDFQKITDKGIKNEYTKIKADSFVKRISNIDSLPEKSVNVSENIKTNLLVSSVLLDFVIGRTLKHEFIDVMNSFSNIKYTKNSNQNFLVYHDLSLIAYFDEQDKLEELEFTEKFTGVTQKGLRIGDSVSKTVKLYGNPIFSHDDSIHWKNFKLTHNDSIVSTFTITGNFETVLFEKNIMIKDFSVYTDGLLLGLIINNSTKSIILNGNDKNYVIKFMEDFSHVKTINKNNNIISYPDTGITFHFDTNKLLYAIELKKNFTGQTIKGLKIGDKVDKALKLYGESLENNKEYLSYKRMKIYHNNDFITSIYVFRENK